MPPELLTILGSAIIVLLALSVAWASLNGAPWVPTRAHDIDRLLHQAPIHNGDVVMDLGSGDGRLVRAAGRMYGARGIGIELSLPMLLVSWIASAAQRIRPRPSFRWRNVFHVDLSGADVVLCFLMPKTLKRLEGKLDRELQRGAWFVSYSFPLPTWTPHHVDKPNNTAVPIYVYRKPVGTDRP